MDRYLRHASIFDSSGQRTAGIAIHSYGTVRAQGIEWWLLRSAIKVGHQAQVIQRVPI